MEDGGFTRITVPTKTAWQPGQHCFLRFTGFGITHAISTHPFTICSLPSTHKNEQSELVFYIRHQRGFTARLYQHALDQPGVSVPVLVDGPYGGIRLQRYYDSDHILVIAGGSGAGWCLPFVELFVRQRSMPTDEEGGRQFHTNEKEGHSRANRSGPLSLQVILATRDTNSRAWFLRTVSELLSKCSSPDLSSNIHAKVYLTGEAAEKVYSPHGASNPQDSFKQSASTSDKTVPPRNGSSNTTTPEEEFVGRPQLPLIVHEEAAKVAEAKQSLSVFVCGPETMQNDVRNAVAKENLNILKGSKARGIYLHSEHFSWA